MTGGHGDDIGWPPARLILARCEVLSSRIEGTQATLGELLASKAGARAILDILEEPAQLMPEQR